MNLPIVHMIILTIHVLLVCLYGTYCRISTESDSDSESSALHGSPLLHETELDNRAVILKACLYLVREGGWSAEVLAEGAKEAGLEGEETELFPNGPGDLVNMFEQQCNEKLFRYMEKQKGSG